MPAIIATELKYNTDNNRFYVYLYQFLSRFQVLQLGNLIFGKLEFSQIDKKVRKEVSKPITLEVKDYNGVFDSGSTEIIRNFGITPNSWICLSLENYSTSSSEEAIKYPIYPEYFEIMETPDALREEIEGKFKGVEEIMKLVQLTGVVEDLKEPYNHLERAYFKFKANFFEDAKTSIRKALETLKKIIQRWKTIDNSSHLADGIKSLINSLYQLSSSGGPHKGIATKDETEVIINSTLYLFKYINKLIGENRFQKDEIARGNCVT